MGLQFDNDIWTLQKISEGSDYSLHVAFWPQEDEKVLIKCVNLHLEDEKKKRVEERLLKEAATLEEFWSPYFPKVYDIRRKENDQLYIIGEYFPGSSLDDFISNNPQNLEAKFYRYLKEELSFALGYLHKRKKIIHLDLSPDNIIIDLDKKVHLIDFENSKVKGTLWNSEQFRGKPSFMAPELKIKDSNTSLNVDESLDLYGLGQILNQLYNSLPRYEKLKLWGEKKYLKDLTHSNASHRITAHYKVEVSQSRSFNSFTNKAKMIGVGAFVVLCLGLSFLFKEPKNSEVLPKKVASRSPALPKTKKTKIKPVKKITQKVNTQQASLKKEKSSPHQKFHQAFNTAIELKDNELQHCLSLFNHSEVKKIRFRYHFSAPPTKLVKLDFLSPVDLSPEAKICIRSVYKDPQIKYPTHKSKRPFELIQSIRF